MILPDESAKYVFDLLRTAYRSIEAARRYTSSDDRKVRDLLSDAAARIDNAIDEMLVQGEKEKK